MIKPKFQIGDHVAHTVSGEESPVIGIRQSHSVEHNLNQFPSERDTIEYCLDTDYGQVWIKEELLEIIKEPQKEESSVFGDYINKLFVNLNDTKSKLDKLSKIKDPKKEEQPAFVEYMNTLLERCGEARAKIEELKIKHTTKRQALQVNLKQLKSLVAELSKDKRELEKKFAMNMKDRDYTTLVGIVNKTNPIESDKWELE